MVGVLGSLVAVKERVSRNMGFAGDLGAGVAWMLRWVLVEDRELGGKGLDEAREAFEGILEDEKSILSGVSREVCLMADESAVRSVLDESETGAPFVGAIPRGGSDRDSSFEKPVPFKVAVDNSIELWEMLQI